MKHGILRVTPAENYTYKKDRILSAPEDITNNL
jgi:hypothetical protein